ncbi:hypothetical protein chiPu_0027284 [Chiloscyllium punctatum]|uniref:Uncharacterized protein n=1 Tax=Chiloscyllium punctatum TaxID=137246 RepID=A0A401TKE9_CHIPU|nr:hypothetical protein [Chiloscyllium punctatum]
MPRWGTVPVLTRVGVSGASEGERAVRLVVTRLSAAVANERPGCRQCRNGGRGLVIEGHGPILELRERRRVPGLSGGQPSVWGLTRPYIVG